MKTSTIAITILVLLVVIGGTVWLINVPAKPGPLDPFATCLKDKGAIFYGAFWCPHCQNTKALFGRAAKLLPYNECSTPDGSGQLQVCKDKGIETYPTWVFADGTREVGELTLAKLAEKTGCVLPQ